MEWFGGGVGASFFCWLICLYGKIFDIGVYLFVSWEGDGHVHGGRYLEGCYEFFSSVVEEFIRESFYRLVAWLIRGKVFPSRPLRVILMWS